MEKVRYEMAKFILESKTQRAWFSDNSGRTEAELLKANQAEEPDRKWISITKLPRGKHICKYCFRVAEGTYDDLLCEECRECFGHALYSEL